MSAKERIRGIAGLIGLILLLCLFYFIGGGGQSGDNLNQPLTPQQIESNQYWDCVAEGACEPPDNEGQLTP